MPKWTFKIAEPGQEPREVPVSAGMTLGRNKKCSLVLKDDSASSRHVLVVEDGDGFAIEDLGSTNGVRLENGSVLVRGNRKRIAEGLRFWLGETEVTVREEKAKPAPAPAPPPPQRAPAPAPAPPPPRPAPAPAPRAAAPKPAAAPGPRATDVEQTLIKSSPPGRGPSPEPAHPAPAREVEDAPTLGGAVPFRMGPEALRAPPPASARPPEEAEEAPTLRGAMPFPIRIGPEALSPPIPAQDRGGKGPVILGPEVLEPAAPAPPPADAEMTMVSGGAGLRSRPGTGPAAPAPPREAQGPRAPGPAPSPPPREEPPEPPAPEADPPAEAEAPAARAQGFEATMAVSKPALSAGASLEALEPRIVLILSQLKRVVRLRSPEFRVGRGSDVDLEIVHPTISNLHAVLRFEGGQFTIEDAGSKNGTFLDKTQLREKQRYELKPESYVRFAAADALFLAKDAAAAPGAAAIDERAAQLLVARKKVTAAEVRSAASSGGHRGERLLVETDLDIADWVQAVRDVSGTEARSSSSTSKLMWIALLGALGLIVLVLLLVLLWR